MAKQPKKASKRVLNAGESQKIDVYPTKADKEREARRQAEEDLRTLQRSKEIQQNKMRMDAARRIAKEQISALGSVLKGKRK